MKRLLLMCALMLCVGCALFRPTYQDVGQTELERLKTLTGAVTAEQLVEDHRALVLEELSRALKLPVQGVSVVDGALVAEIQPASEQIAEDVIEEGMEDPTNPASWAKAGGAAALTAIMGLLGLRGRSQRKREEVADAEKKER